MIDRTRTDQVRSDKVAARNRNCRGECGASDSMVRSLTATDTTPTIARVRVAPTNACVEIYVALLLGVSLTISPP